MDLRNGDCLELMKTLPDKSVDLLLCDLPYGETNCKWDTKIDMEEFWKEFKRIRKSPKVACIHFCSTKFGYSLIKSWEKGYKMDLVWKKRNKTGGLQSRHRPMRNHEMMYFFYDQSPKYNRDKYHKRIKGKKESNIEQEGGTVYGLTSKMKNTMHQCFEPPNPASVVEEEKTNYMGKTKQQVLDSRSENGKKHLHTFEPPNPASVVEEEQEKQGRKMYKDTTLGDIYLKKEVGAVFEPPNPASVVEEKDEEYGKECKGIPFLKGMNGKEFRDKIKKDGFKFNYEPPNPASVVEEKFYKEKGKNGHGWDTHKPEYGNGFEPPNPASVVEEDERINEKGKSAHGWNIDYMDKPRVPHFDPKLPVSVLEDETDIYGEKANDIHERYLECGCGYYDPPNPASVVESEKVFIGKRNHQTEKPQDVLEFLLKYWTDEDDVVLDPTMGSGSTGVACKTLKRKFIGFELDPKIYEVACNRINKIDLKTEAKKNKKKTKKI